MYAYYAKNEHPDGYAIGELPSNIPVNSTVVDELNEYYADYCGPDESFRLSDGVLQFDYVGQTDDIVAGMHNTLMRVFGRQQLRYDVGYDQYVREPSGNTWRTLDSDANMRYDNPTDPGMHV